MKRNFEITAAGKFRGVIYRRTLKSPGDDFGMAYIGKTTNEQTRQRMWSNVKNSHYGGKKITEARNRHELTDWDYEILEEIISDDTSQLEAYLSEREQFWIKEYNSVENGLNGSYGNGNLGSTFKWQDPSKHRDYQSKETRRKISESLKGRKVSEKTRLKISEGNKGKKRTDEQREAQSARMKGNIPITAIEGAKRWRKENGGSFWKGKKMPDSAREKMKANARKKSIPVIATFTDGSTKTYDTMLDAAKDNGLGVGSIHHCLTNNGTTKQGIKFSKVSH